MRYRYLDDFRRGISVFAIFSYGIAVLGTPQCPPPKSKLAPLQRRSVLDDLVLSLKSLKSSCEFHIPRARIRRWAEFKRRMINLCMTFWSIISELTTTVLLSLRGKHLKDVFFLNDAQFLSTLLKEELQMSNFVLALFFHPLLKPKENMFGLVRQHVLSLKSFFSFHSTFLKQDWDVDLNLRKDVIFLDDTLADYIWLQTELQKEEHLRISLRKIITFHLKRRSSPFHILTRRTNNVKFCVNRFCHSWTRALSHL